LAEVIVTASLTNGIARVAHGQEEALRLIDLILKTEHTEWETTLAIGEVEYHATSQGPFPNHQLRISVNPRAGIAALNYMDNDAEESIMNSFNPAHPLPEVDLIFSGTTGDVFPRTAAIPIQDARDALLEWIETWHRPTCIQWRPYDSY
jgi:hypothetical protein